MDWVLDTSIAMAWCFDDERTERSEALLDRLAARSSVVVPQIWPLEVANVLIIALRKKRITPAKRSQFLAMLAQASITVEHRAVRDIFNDVLVLADRYRLSIYDASYLELAMRLGLPLATLDRELTQAATDAGVTVW